MDKEKLIEWLKRLYGVKERLVFGLVACVLAFRVYQILDVKPPPPEGSGLGPPINIPGIEPVPAPILTPRPTIAEWMDLYRKPTMFEERADKPKGDDEGTPDRMQDFVLDSIQMSAGRPMAFIRSKKGGKRYFAPEGETFESDFTVVKIDAEKKTVDVRDSETGKIITLSIE